MELDKSSPRWRRGVTLLELMIVVSIIILVTVIALPTIGPLLKGREIREASRTFSAFLTQAQTRAIELGRPVGVAIVRSETAPDAGIQLYLCETPPPISGTFDFDRAVIEYADGEGLVMWGFRPFRSRTIAQAHYREGMYKPGDRMRLGYRGVQYEIALRNSAESDRAFDENGYLTLDSLPWRLAPPTNGDHPSLPSMSLDVDGRYTADMPFVIYRQPVRTAEEPITLPPGTAVDLSVSGYEGDFSFSQAYAQRVSGSLPPTGDVMITFEPDGSVGGVYASGRRLPLRATAIYLLVGKQEKTATVGDSLWNTATSGGEKIPTEPVFNIQDGDSRWVKIEPMTGIVTVSEIEPPDDLFARPGDAPFWSAALNSRILAREGAPAGG